MIGRKEHEEMHTFGEGMGHEAQAAQDFGISLEQGGEGFSVKPGKLKACMPTGAVI